MDQQLLKQLADKRVLVIKGRIDRDTFDFVQEQILRYKLEDSQESINVIIDSQGGDLDSSLLIYDTLILSGIHCETTIHGECSSAAITVLMAGCNGRSMTKHSYIRMHSNSATFEVTITDSSKAVLEKLFEAEIARRKQIIKIIAEKTQLSSEMIEQLTDEGDHGIMIYAPRALELGLVNVVLPGSCINVKSLKKP